MSTSTSSGHNQYTNSCTHTSLKHWSNMPVQMARALSAVAGSPPLPTAASFQAAKTTKTPSMTTQATNLPPARRHSVQRKFHNIPVVPNSQRVHSTMKFQVNNHVHQKHPDFHNPKVL